MCREGICRAETVPDRTGCDDGDACTVEDACTEGVCQGTPRSCDDSDPCTADRCVGGDCEHAPVTGPACDDDDACTVGDRCEVGVCEGTPMDCDDDNECTDDHCDEGACRHQPQNGVACQGRDRCIVEGVCVAGECVGEARDCDDGNPCTEDDCDEGECRHAAQNGTDCDDGDACTSPDHCEQGMCTGARRSCDDDNPCTRDSCVGENGCGHANVDDRTPCDDGDPCTVETECLDGACRGRRIPCEDDGDPCTAEVCEDGVCAHPPRNEGACEDDGDPCTADVCRGGACAHEPAAEGGPCEGDEDPCTVALCRDGACVQSPVDGEPCTGDDNPCTTDVCRAGECAHEATDGPCADDENPCTADVCRDGACAHVALDAVPCGEATVCAGAPTCRAGECDPGDEPACELPPEAGRDAPCLDPVCEVEAGGCVVRPVDGDCERECGALGRCSGGVCEPRDEVVACEEDWEARCDVACTTPRCDVEADACTCDPIPEDTLCPSGACRAGVCAQLPCDEAPGGRTDTAVAPGGFVVANRGGRPADDAHPSMDFTRVEVEWGGAGARFTVHFAGEWQDAPANLFADYTISFSRPGEAASPEAGPLNGASDMYSWGTRAGARWSCHHRRFMNGGWVSNDADFCHAQGHVIEFAPPLAVAPPCGHYRVVASYLDGPRLTLKALTSAGLDPNGPPIPMPLGLPP